MGGGIFGRVKRAVPRAIPDLDPPPLQPFSSPNLTENENQEEEGVRQNEDLLKETEKLLEFIESLDHHQSPKVASVRRLDIGEGGKDVIFGIQTVQEKFDSPVLTSLTAPTPPLIEAPQLPLQEEGGWMDQPELVEAEEFSFKWPLHRLA